ncbi:hypothetical protein [Ferruginibacter sp. SUN106]|uniref:hypothetical protein n=1 Tax=Ferruginibacter sp. SUN106 TaxID=2978348 RepID=UPI003D3604C3
MKKIFTFLAVMAIFSSSFAQWQGGNDRGTKYDTRNNSYNSSSLVINAFTEKRFTVMIDNMQYELNDNYRNTRRDNSIAVGAMSPGRHTVTVYEYRSSFWGKQKQKVMYSSVLFFKPGVETALNINNYGQVNITEKQGYQNNGYGRDDRRRDDDRRHDNDHDGWRH